MTHIRIPSRSAESIRWVARLSTIPVFAFVVLFMLLPDVIAATAASFYADFFFLSLSLFGLFLGWRRPGAGGALTLLAVAADGCYHLMAWGAWPPEFPAVALMLSIPAGLFVAGSVACRARHLLPHTTS